MEYPQYSPVIVDSRLQDLGEGKFSKAPLFPFNQPDEARKNTTDVGSLASNQSHLGIH